MERDKPIAFDTVVTVNSTGHTINSWGKDLFFLPHMITVDSENNIWMTDVALHQIFKFAPYGGDHKPLLTLGTRFQPGSDDRWVLNSTVTWHKYILGTHLLFQLWAFSLWIHCKTRTKQNVRGYYNKNSWIFKRLIFKIVIIHNPSLGSFGAPHKI